MGLSFKTLSQELFTAWVTEKTPGSFVGCSGDNYQCPIATFVKEAYYPDAQNQVSVGVQTCAVYDRASPNTGFIGECEIPEWAKAFINAVDKLSNQRVQVTREQALQSLGEVAVA